MGFGITRLDCEVGYDVGLRRVDEVGLHGLQNCTSMWVQFWGIIYNIILYYYNDYFIKLHRCAILQFMQFCANSHFHKFTHPCRFARRLRGGYADVTRRLDSWRFLKIVHFQEGRGSGSRDA